jgi:hypothetical protein
MWADGKQHGLGVFYTAEGKMKRGIWEDGKKLQWLDEEEVRAIEKGEMDFSLLFKEGESYEKIRRIKFSFFKGPENFENSKKKLRLMLSEMAQNPLATDDLKETSTKSFE